MTRAEFNTFIGHLFIQFPSLADRIERLRLPSGIEADAIMDLWFQKLGRFTLGELRWILDDWNTRGVQPWDSYPIEQAVAVLYSTAQHRRDKHSRKQESEKIQSAGRKPTNADGFKYSNFSVSMRAAFESLRPVHRRWLDGEISETEWIEFKESVLCSL